MSIKQVQRTMVLVLALFAMPCAYAQAPAAQPVKQADASGEKTWTVNIRNADIQAFITQVAEMTGKNFVIDPRVRSRDVTVISKQALPGYPRCGYLPSRFFPPTRQPA